MKVDEDSAAVPGLGDLRAWREAQAKADDGPVKPVAEVHGMGEWDDDALADRPLGASENPDDEPPPPPGEPLGAHLLRFFHLELDDALVLARPEDRRGLLPETLVVLGVSLGASAVWSVLSLIDSLTRSVPLNQQTTTINASVTPDRPYLDLAYQLAHIVLPLVPVALAFYLLARVRRPDGAPYRVMGIQWSNAPKDTALGVLLAAIIGIPGLGLYVIARALGYNLNVSPGNLSAYWWTIPAYILLAAMNGVLEETVMIGYLFTRWTQLAMSPWRVIVASALIRGAYHLYQGWGGGIGNFLMGLLFGWVYMRTRRVLPLVIAHTILDIVSFVGYSLLHNVLTWL